MEACRSGQASEAPTGQAGGAALRPEGLPLHGSKVSQPNETTQNTSLPSPTNGIPPVRGVAREEPVSSSAIPDTSPETVQLFRSLQQVKQALAQPLNQLQEQAYRQSSAVSLRKRLRRALISFSETDSPEENLPLPLRKLKKVTAALQTTSTVWAALQIEMGIEEDDVEYSERTTTLSNGLAWLEHEFKKFAVTPTDRLLPFPPHIKQSLNLLKDWLAPGVASEDHLASVLVDCLSVVRDLLLEAIEEEKKTLPATQPRSM